ncbi:MAG TPA: NAD-dependent epimerase/dehydratase family protein [Thermomicrobiales bacterium]|jgi:nucleoside-diphosphate-sugar epimerase
MQTATELHVVYGNGPVGSAVIATLLGQGKRVRVVTRSGARKGLPPTVEVVRGDATDPADARRACAGATHVYNCTNPRDYHRWPAQFPPLQRGVLAGATTAGAKLIVMENLYLYGPHGGRPLTEATPQRGVGPRSTTRRAMSAELFAAHRRGQVRAASVRASDLFGPLVRESLAGERLFGPALAGKPIQLLANPDLPHSLTYAPDAGRAMVAVGADDAALGHAWHVPNAPAITLRAFIGLVCAEIGVPPRVSAIPRPLARALLPLLGLFVPPMRGISENAYIFYEPYIVDHSRYAATFGDHATPLPDAIRETVRWYRAHAAQPTSGNETTLSFRA